MSSINHEGRVLHEGLSKKIMSAEQAAAFIKNDMNVGMSGFTGAGYPKAIPAALAKHMEAAHARGEDFQIGLLTGASTATECDGVLADAKGIKWRTPYQSEPALRKQINAGEALYFDMHLSHVAQQSTIGFYGDMHVAVVEVAGILPDGRLIPSTSIGTSNAWLNNAAKIILEVNAQQSLMLEGMHDVYNDIGMPPNRKPIPLVTPGGRIGDPYLSCDLDKVVAVVLTNSPDRNSKFADPDECSNQIASHIIDFFHDEVKKGRLPANLLPIQSGVGNVANAVLAGLQNSPFEQLTGYTEVLQDGMLDLIMSGKMTMASATALSLSPDALKTFNANIADLRARIVLRPQEITNHPEVARRLGVLAINAMIECDLYGNVNSTHVMGTNMMNGLGGSGDFARNAYTSFFVSPSVAKDGAISCITPMVSHHDHTEHDVMVIVTEQGLADLRGLAPRQRAQAIIDNCAHPDYRPMLQDYFDRASSTAGMQTPHILNESLSWHQRYVETGDMRIK
ncbi:acetyl-CoA hydrolase/transferase family protein [Psychrobacter sp. TAE2020]|uniref:acetyl-CoA hydrolase/transferase family protein n=1 Tax=Psychrobacter sp. TAE2020 TaxID=2846762 RepID=UPI001C101181|nr:acetyl-CoA hydrolase/transferase family protein [Psychrobacter sp. TAE2020]MBU5615510.1 acetyl-CoA hydrolase/transferase family protein [Psychrobacter sp. TAE2020]